MFLLEEPRTPTVWYGFPATGHIHCDTTAYGAWNKRYAKLIYQTCKSSILRTTL